MIFIVFMTEEVGALEDCESIPVSRTHFEWLANSTCRSDGLVPCLLVFSWGVGVVVGDLVDSCDWRRPAGSSETMVFGGAKNRAGTLIWENWAMWKMKVWGLGELWAHSQKAVGLLYWTAHCLPGILSALLFTPAVAEATSCKWVWLEGSWPQQCHWLAHIVYSRASLWPCASEGPRQPAQTWEATSSVSGSSWGLRLAI